MEKIKEKMAVEVSKIEERKAKIEDELKEVQVRKIPSNLIFFPTFAIPSVLLPHLAGRVLLLFSRCPLAFGR